MSKIRFIHVSDFHYLASEREQCESNGIAVKEAANKHNVDFIVSAGDFWHRSHYNSEKDGIKSALKIMNSWTEVCPTGGLYGTPAHDSPGSMSIFPKFKVFEPYQIYGFYNDEFDSYIEDVNKYDKSKTTGQKKPN